MDRTGMGGPVADSIGSERVNLPFLIGEAARRLDLFIFLGRAAVRGRTGEAVAAIATKAANPNTSFFISVYSFG